MTGNIDDGNEDEGKRLLPWRAPSLRFASLSPREGRLIDLRPGNRAQGQDHGRGDAITTATLKHHRHPLCCVTGVETVSAKLPVCYACSVG